ncbi:MAG TPA: lysoplasmalogenase [Phototrophicaceae bacterium]|nr:lysoplasmalogenase [Phototrophicaceae bacterium]
MFLAVIANYGGLVGLLLLWAVLLFGGLIVGQPDAERTRRMPASMRLPSSLVLVVAAWSGFLLVGESGRTIGLLVAVGMTLGFIGDLFMARVIPMQNNVLGGIAAFGLGHVIYILAFWQVGAGAAFASRWPTLIIWWLVAGVAWYVVVFRGQKPTPLHYAVLPYALLLSSTAGVATILALTAPALFLTLAVGAALFLVSDLILAAGLFNGLRLPFIHDIVWLTYGPAQMFIVYSMLGALLGSG